MKNRYIAIRPYDDSKGVGITEINRENGEVIAEYYGVRNTGEIFQITLGSKCPLKKIKDTGEVVFALNGERLKLNEFRKVATS